MVALTIGMATYNDFDGVYFTMQALRLYQDLDDTELLVVDNYGCEPPGLRGGRGRRPLRPGDGGGGDGRAQEPGLCRGAEGRRCSAATRTCFRAGSHRPAQGLLPRAPRDAGPAAGTAGLRRLAPLHPLRARLAGTDVGHLGHDQRGLDPEGEPFEIWGQGLGVFSCRKDAWPGFHPAFRGFGGEEGYIHEKVRQRGARCACPGFAGSTASAAPQACPIP